MKYIEALAYILAMASILAYQPVPQAAPYLLAAAAAMMVVVRLKEKPRKGHSRRVRRLLGMRGITPVLWLVGMYLMFVPGNYWLLCLTVSAVIEIYTLIVLSRIKNQL